MYMITVAESRLGMFDENDSQTFESSEFVEMILGLSLCREVPPM